MRVSMSKYLINQKDILRELVVILSKDFKYVSVLGTDVRGKSYSVYKTGASINDSSGGERGFVVRLHNGYNYSEYSFNELSLEGLDSLCKDIKDKINDDINKLKASDIKLSSYPVVEEDKVMDKHFKEVEILPEEVSAEEKI